MKWYWGKKPLRQPAASRKAVTKEKSALSGNWNLPFLYSFSYKT
jgi:hypothetical protein